VSISFYYGLDNFRIKEAIDKKIASFVAKNKDGLVERLDFEKENCLEDVENILKRRSLFDEPELIIVYASLSDKDLSKKNQKLFDFLTKIAEEKKEFSSIKGATLEKWALEKIMQAGFKIKTPVLKKLVSSVGEQGKLAQEIEKLIAYQSYHGRREIDEKSIWQLIQGSTLYVDNFALIDALGNRDIKRAVIFLNQDLEKGSDPHAILGQIIYQFRNLLKVKSYTAAVYLHGSRVNTENIAEVTGLHPFVAQKTSRQAREFELEELKNIYHRLAELDLKSKNGQIDLIPALFKFMLML